jgi:hypothetical protein
VAPNENRRALGDAGARQLVNTTKTSSQLAAITPRWLVQFLSWVPVESGTYRVNKVRDEKEIDVACGSHDERKLPATYVDYEEKPPSVSSQRPWTFILACPIFTVIHTIRPANRFG